VNLPVYRAYLGLGSNIGPRHEHLAGAIGRLSQIARITAVSSVYETEPVGMEEADDFLNIAVEIDTEDDPPLLLAKLRTIEKALGRKPSARSVPRTIDIDILLYRGMTYDDHMVSVPHPRLHLRRFALEPLNEIAPAALHPSLEKTVSWLLRHCRDAHRVALAGKLAGPVAAGGE
jgi:2-amino-4-hydroxy-6-hydroxymethyldihydropteridine diphosphokinase